MGKMKPEPGVVTGDALEELFDYCQQAECALPAVNVIGSHSVNAVLAAARDAVTPVIIQFSNGGAHFFAGKFLPNDHHEAEIAGAVAGARYVHAVAEHYGVPVVLHTDHAARRLLPWVEGMIDEGERHYETTGRPLFSSHMLDLSEESLEDNVDISQKILERLSAIDMTLEIELGVTGGEEDGVDNSDIDDARLYTQPEDVLHAYESLSPVGSFTVAAAFGNTHGVYKPGNVVLTPVILKNSQDAIRAKHGTGENPVRFVFHGGSGSSRDEIREAVSYGVVKMNVDTDTQWAFCEPIKHYMDEKDAYLHAQVGNPEGDDQPNKKHIDPRRWLHLAEQGMAVRVVQAFEDLDSLGRFDF
jgi:fructose-bisphosphate aldolase class II